MAFYNESTDRPNQSRVAAEDIDAGTLVIENGSDKLRRASAENDTSFDGVADAPKIGDYIAADIDDVVSFTYKSADDDRVPYIPTADRDLVKVRTIKDNGTDPAPSINDGDVVILPDASSFDSGGQDIEGRVVQEGYTDDSDDTYNHSNADGVLVGKAYKDSATGFDEVVRVEIRKDV